MASDKGSWGVVVFLLIIIIIGDAATGAFSSRAPPFKQSGSAICTVANGGTTCTTPTSTYTTAYQKTPIESIVNVTYNAAPFHTLTTTDTFQAEGGVNFMLPQNSTQLLFDTEASVNATVPNTDTSLKTFSPAYWPSVGSAFNALPQIRVQADGFLQTHGTSTLQDVSIKIEDSGCSGTVIATMTVHQVDPLPGKDPWSLTGVETVALFSSNVALCIQAPAADANTQVIMVDMHVYLLQNHFQVWPSMPVAVTELFGNNQHEQTWLFDSTGYSGTLEICVNVFAISGGASATLQAQYGTTNFGPAIPITTLGNQCTSGAATIPTNVQTLRIVGANGAGASDIPAFGAISISWSYSISKTLSFSVFNPGNPATVTISNTGISLKYTFVSTVNNAAGVVVTISFEVYGI